MSELKINLIDKDGNGKTKKKPIINNQMSKLDTSVEIPEFLKKGKKCKKKI